MQLTFTSRIPEITHFAMPNLVEYAPMYDFEATDDFLQSLSGVMPSLLPSLFEGDDHSFGTYGPESQELDHLNIGFKNPKFESEYISPKSDNWEQTTNQQQQQPQYQAQLHNLYGQPPIFTETPQPLFSQMLKQEQPYDTGYIQDNRKSSAMSITNSTSRSSTSNGLSPDGHASISSTHTSPEYIGTKQDDPVTKKVVTKHEAASKVSKPLKKDKCSHNMIEKKYRTNINSKILALRDAVPSLRIATGDTKDISIADLEGLTPASKLNKASVLTKATEYIKHLEKKNEILRVQNAELQRIINEVSPRRSESNNHPPVSGTGNFGFMPLGNEQSYNTTVNNASNFDSTPSSFGNNYNFRSQQHQQTPNLSTGQKVLLGGLATVMGTSMFSNGVESSDFSGLSALPFLPYSLRNPSMLTLQLFNFLRSLVLLAAIAYIAYPVLFTSNTTIEDVKTKDLTSLLKLYKNYFFISFGFQLPTILKEDKKNAILARLNGGADQPLTFIGLVNDYVYITSCEITFESCFLNLVIGKLLTTKYPLLTSIIDYNMSLKASIIRNINYKGDDVYLSKLNQLIHEFDGVAILGSASLFTRLTNLADHSRSINDGVYDELNRLKYVELFQENHSNYYGVIFSWRILELCYDLNLKYLSNLADKKLDAESRAKLIVTIQEDVAKMSNLVEPKSGCASASKKLVDYMSTFKAVINPEKHGLELKHYIQSNVEGYLANFKTLKEGQVLTDSVTLTSSESEGESYEPSDANERTHTDAAAESKSLITSLNLVTQDQFIILTSAMVLYYNEKDHDQATKLLSYFSFEDDNTELSVLSFTILLKVIIAFSAAKGEHNEILDRLIRIERLWINDKLNVNILDAKTRQNISDMIIDKSLILNGLDESECVEE